MAHSSWLYLVYGVGLFYLSLNPSKVSSIQSLRNAWVWYIVAMSSAFFFTLFQAGNWSNPSSLVLVEFWSQGFSWLFVTISLCFLPGALLKGGGLQKTWQQFKQNKQKQDDANE